MSPSLATRPERPVAPSLETIALLGRGGMGEVWLARRSAGLRGELVAVKQLLPELADVPELAEQFAREAAIGLRLRHPAIARVLELVLEPAPRIVMELIHGVAASRLARALRVRRRPCPVELVTHVGARVAGALEHACTAHGLVHRDISPHNVMLTFAGEVQLVDFGIARLPDLRRLTRTGVIKGKLEYMSPEQARGEPVDGRSDVFSLGVVLYELAAGTSPFLRPSSPATLEAVRACRPAPLASVREDIPAPLAELVHAMLRPAPAQRPDATGVRDALGDASATALQHDLLAELFPQAADRAAWIASLEERGRRPAPEPFPTALTVARGANTRPASGGEGVDPAPPPRLDEYEVLRPLGRGGMGAVYLAHDTVLDRRVAIKLIARQQPDRQSRERFLVEARAAARVQHANVAAIHRIGEHAGRPYLVSEYVEGECLDRLPLPLSWRDALELALGLARGLEAAHARGVLHRDIKPSNAILTADGAVKLLDFGVAKLFDRPDLPADDPASPTRSRLTEAGAAVGTPCYMAPEVARGEPATTASDLYSLGALLHELLIGQPPARDLGELVSLGRDLPSELGTIVTRLLAADPGLRFASASEVAQALERLRPISGSHALPDNPYRGLGRFEAEHARLFFGREIEAAEVVERLERDTFLLVTGDSGTGKSSFCRAGVLPRLAGRRIDGRCAEALTVVPGRRPLVALAAALGPVLGTKAERVVGWMLGGTAELEAALDRELGGDRGLVLFVDQLEEVVTVSDELEAHASAQVLALFARRPGLRLLGSVRADFLSRVAMLPGLGELAARAVYLLRPLSQAGVREAVVGPARAFGVTFEDDALVGELTATAQTPGALPLVQFALAELWDARDRERRVITRDALARIGGVTGALVRQADAVIAELVPGERAAARRLLTRLAGNDGTRTPLRATEVFAMGLDAVAARDALVAGRLVCVREADEGTMYELAHEALLSHWDTLREWNERRRDQAGVLRRVGSAADEWDRLGRCPEALWSGRLLDEARALDRAELGPREQAFLASSQRAGRRRRWRRLGAVIGLLACLAGVLLAARGRATAQREALIATARARADQARTAAGQARDQARAARLAAFAAFDRGEAGAAEARWAEVRPLEQATDRDLELATRHLEAASLVAPTRTELRALLGDITLERALLAEQRGLPELSAALAGRLDAYDGSATLRERWTAPARVTVVTQAGAEIRARRYQGADDGQLTLGEARLLGRAPLGEARLEPGSYVLEAVVPGRPGVRLPVLLGRGEERVLTMPFPAADRPDLLYVPPGVFLYGSGDGDLLRTALGAEPLRPVVTGAFYIARHETTFADWISYLEALPPGERARRLPHAGGFSGALALERIAPGDYRLTIRPPGGEPQRAASGERITLPGRSSNREQDWLRLPVAGITADDAEAYAAWLDRSGWVPGARLCTEREWERAARGADGRDFPTGSTLPSSAANFDETYGKLPGAFGPDVVGSHPESRSPSGVDDAAGNVWEWTRRSRGGHALRGGSYYQARLTTRTNNAEIPEPTIRDMTIGLRICATAR